MSENYNVTKRVPSAAFQENGQRRYGGPPPDWNGPPPERGSEIFVGKLPRDLFEDELVPLCEKVTEERLPHCCPRSFLTLLFPSSVWSNLRGEDDDGLQRQQPRLRLRHLQQQTGSQSSDETAQQLRDQVMPETHRNDEEIRSGLLRR